ncbi:unnamed protein product, partial [Polarella glacialis]
MARRQDEDEDEDDEKPIYEQRARLDQVLQFFDFEFEKYSGYFEDPQRLEHFRVEYYNCVNAVEFQDELIAQLVEALLALRSQLRSGS